MLGKKTGGRKKGSRNKGTQELERLRKRSGLEPLDFMLKVMRDETKPDEIRADCAKAAAQYRHAKRAPEDREGKTVPPMVYLTPNLEDD
jgi:hypothetical protein